MAEGLKKSAAATPSEGRQQNAVEEKVREIEGRLSAPLGAPTAQQTADYKAGWSDFILTAEENLTVKLPFATRAYVGRLIPVKNLHASDNVAVRPAGADTIDGVASAVSVEPTACYGYLCVAEGEWVELWRPVSSGGGGWVWAPTAVKTSNYTCGAFYEMVLCDADTSGGNFTVTMPTITSADVGKMIAVKIVDARYVVSIAAAGGQSYLDGYALSAPYETIVLAAINGTQWSVVYHWPGVMS